MMAGNNKARMLFKSVKAGLFPLHKLSSGQIKLLKRYYPFADWENMVEEAKKRV